MTDPVTNPPAAAKGGAGPRRWMTGVALAAAFVAGGVTLPGLAALAQGPAAAGMHHMMGGHGDMHAHIAKVLDQVGASDEQKAKITAILDEGFKPMGAMHGQMHENMAALHAALTAPTVDRGALEQVRARQIADLDQASRSMTKALADAADVLRPDQRAKLAGMMAEHHHDAS